ncbi:MAG: DEAD/DEAH box helicase [Bacillota bacterium]|nr:DEAD/DEAH box helicase [Bacillota bacterium]
MNFNNFALSNELKRAIEELGYTEATEIQEQAIPAILEGKDILGLSATGSGKTAAYGLPALESIDISMDAKYPQVLILSPTRELAMQVTDELRKFSKYKERTHIVPVYGGQPINRQVALIRSGCQIVVGTPGRIMDLLDRRILKFTALKTVILDEADEMLNMGFRDDVEKILSDAPQPRQTLLFSATMPKAIIEITRKFQNDPVNVKIKSTQMAAVNIEQSFFEVAKGHKKDALSLLLQYYQPKLSLVFCNTKKMTDEVAANLKECGYAVEALHGDMKQEQRAQVMNRFKNRAFKILVATDVAARGIDVNDIEIVFNYDLPEDFEYYIHRIGRTARGGKEGKSFTLIENAKQYSFLQKIASYTNSTITKRIMPTVVGIKNQIADEFLAKIRTFAQAQDCTKCAPQLNTLREGGMSDSDIAAVLLQMFLNEKLLKKGTIDVPVAAIRKANSVESEKSGRGNDKRGERKQNEKAQKKFENVPMEIITISIGRKDKVAPKHILGAIAGESGLPGSIMGSIDIQNNLTTVEVPEQFKTRIIKALNQKTIKDKKVTVK